MRGSDTHRTPTNSRHPTTRTPRTAARDLARALLRHRAVLYEGRRRDELARRGRKHQPLTLTPEQADALPLLAAYLADHPAPGGGGWPPGVTRSAAAMTRTLEALHAARGPLVLVTANLDTLDALPLKSRELADLARELVAVYLEEVARPHAPHTAAVQRGTHGGTHAHLVLALADLQPEYAQPVQAARAGPGGGCELLGGDVHAVRLAHAPRNRARVAAYLTRDPDARLDDPHRAAYLQAHEDELRRKQGGHRSPRLTWSRGIQTPAHSCY